MGSDSVVASELITLFADHEVKKQQKNRQGVHFFTDVFQFDWLSFFPKDLTTKKYNQKS